MFLPEWGGEGGRERNGEGKRERERDEKNAFQVSSLEATPPTLSDRGDMCFPETGMSKTINKLYFHTAKITYYLRLCI